MPTISTDKVTGSRSISRTEAEINDSTTPITKCPPTLAKGATTNPVTQKQINKDRRTYRDNLAQQNQHETPVGEFAYQNNNPQPTQKEVDDYTRPQDQKLTYMKHHMTAEEFNAQYMTKQEPHND